MSSVGQGTKRHRNIAENFNRLSRVHERYGQTDDRQTIDDGRTDVGRQHKKLSNDERDLPPPISRIVKATKMQEMGSFQVVRVIQGHWK